MAFSEDPSKPLKMGCLRIGAGLIRLVALAYNAKSGPGIEPALESQFRVFKDGKEYYKGKLEPVDITGSDPLKGIPIVKRLLFNKMEEGEYLLELTVTDKQAKPKANTAVPSIDFEIVKGIP
jgi:hypothetical protein